MSLIHLVGAGFGSAAGTGTLIPLRGHGFGAATGEVVWNSIMMQVLEAVKDVIEGLALAGLSEVVIRKFPWHTKDLAAKTCIICPASEALVAATNESDDFGYGVQVTFVDTSNRRLTTDADFDALMVWRETAELSFSNERPLALATVYQTTVEPGPVLDLQAFLANYDATAFVVRAWIRRMKP